MKTQKAVILTGILFTLLSVLCVKSQSVPLFHVSYELTGEVSGPYDSLVRIRIIVRVPEGFDAQEIKISGKEKKGRPEKFVMRLDMEDKSLTEKKVITKDGGNMVIDLGVHAVSEGLYHFDVRLKERNGTTVEAKETAAGNHER